MRMRRMQRMLPAGRTEKGITEKEVGREKRSRVPFFFQMHQFLFKNKNYNNSAL